MSDNTTPLLHRPGVWDGAARPILCALVRVALHAIRARLSLDILDIHVPRCPGLGALAPGSMGYPRARISLRP